MIPIPFTIRRTSLDQATFVYTVTDVNGLIGMDEDGLVLQYRVKTSQSGTYPAVAPTESEVHEVRLPLGAVRRAELRGRWFGTKLVLFAADLRAFDPFRSWLKGSELVLTIPAPSARARPTWRRASSWP